MVGNVVFTPGGGPFGIRFQTGGVVYGSREIPVPVPGTGGLVTEDLSTDNWLLNVGLGPQVMARSGPVRPYAYALAGFGYFATDTSFGNGYDYYGDPSTTNYDDWTFAWSAGAGLLIPVSRSLAIDVGVQYVGNGTVRYLAEGDLRPSPEGVPARDRPASDRGQPPDHHGRSELRVLILSVVPECTAAGSPVSP